MQNYRRHSYFHSYLQNGQHLETSEKPLLDGLLY